MEGKDARKETEKTVGGKEADGRDGKTEIGTTWMRMCCSQINEQGEKKRIRGAQRLKSPERWTWGGQTPRSGSR